MKNVLKTKRLVAWMLVFVLAVTTVFQNGIVAQAASSNTVKSVTVKIGSKKVTKKTYTLTKGKTATLKVSVSPSKAKKSVTYKSNKTGVASVNKKGKVTAKKAGTAKITITVTGKDSKKKSTWVKIKVKNASTTQPTPQQPTTVAPESVTAIIAKSPIAVGEATVITATVLPANATDKKVTYSSSNAAVASVNEAGVVTGIGKGQAVITVATSNGKTATVAVVVNDIEVTSIKLDQSEINLSISQTTTLTPTIEPANATSKTLTWETSDAAVATVEGGRVTAKGVGTATITVKSANGVKAECKVTVSQETTLENGITIEMTNPYTDANGKKYENTALVGDNMAIRARVVKDNQPLGNTDVTLTMKKGYGNCSPAFAVRGQSTVKTDENGYATFSIGLKDDYSDYTAVDKRYQSYIVTAQESDSNKSAELTVSFASVKLTGIQVENGNGIYPKIVPSDNANTNDSGIFSTYYSDPTKKEQYVSSQQVSSSDDDHMVYFSATPYLVLPATKSTEHTDNWEYTVTDGTSGSCSVYNDATNETTTVRVASVPAGLQSITLDFNKLELSKYTALNVDMYNSATGGNLYHAEYTAAKNGSDSIQVEQQTDVDSYLVVSLISQGQVDTTSAGYVLTKVYGPWKSADTMDPVSEEIAGAVQWSKIDTVRYENQEWTYEEAQKYFPADSKYLNASYKYSYRIPVWPNTGNALITVKDSNEKEIGNFLYPTVNNGSNVNVLAEPSDNISAIFASASEIEDKVGTVSQEGNLAVVDSQKVGITALKANVTVAGLDTQELNSLNGGELYTSVQWAPVPNVEEEPEYPDYFAIEGQTVEVTAQLYDKSGNIKTDENKTIEFSDANGKMDLNTNKAGNFAALVRASNGGSTDNQGKVTLIFRDVTDDSFYSRIEGLTAKAKGYNVKLTFDGGKSYVETGDIYWVDLGLSFVNTAVKDDTQIRTTQFENSKKEIAATASYNVSETVEWKIGYQVVARSNKFRYKNLSLTGVDYVDAASTQISEFISVSGVSLKYGIDSDNVSLAEQNGTAILKSTIAGKAQLTGKLVVSDPTAVVFKFYDQDGKIVEYTSVGKGDPAVTSTVLALNTEWKASGTQVELIVPSKVNVNASATVYVKVTDNLGNALKDQKVEYSVTGANATTGYVTAASTNAKGITSITLSEPDTSSYNTSVVKVKVNDSIEKSETLYYSADPNEEFTIAADTDNRYAVKVDSDLKTIYVYFSRDVDETSIKAGQFTFAQDGSTETTYTVESAEISATATNCVKLTLDKAIANKGAAHTLSVKAYEDSSGIQYLLRDVDGQIVKPGSYAFKPSERQ